MTTTHPTVKTVELPVFMGDSYFQYAVETITQRALTRVEDGLYPVQRRVLFAMMDMGLLHNRAHKKSARVVGEVLGKYHPHGDSSVYGAMVRMAQNFSLRDPLVDGQGSFGSIDGDSPAAMRYTEARLSALAERMMQDINQDTIDWQDNFDGSLQEPSILPTAFPNLLVNGTSGLAVSMAAKMPPHNLGEVCDALMYVAKNWAKRDKITVDQLMRYIPGPDFPTGGMIYRYRVQPGSNGEADTVVDTIRAAYATGLGRIVTQARVNIEPGKNGKADIIITELPYTVMISAVVERIAEVVRDGKITGVTDLRDTSDYTGMRIIVEVGRGSDPREVLEKLLTHTQLRQTFGVINRTLVVEDGREVPKLLSLGEILTRFVQHRLTVIERRTRYELGEREARLHIVEGLIKALDVIDQVIATIRKSKTTETARENLVKEFKFSELQARAILAMQLSRLASMERTKLKEEGRELWERIKYLRALLASEEKRLEVVIEETVGIKKEFNSPRRTVIIDREDQAAGMAAATTESELVVPDSPQVVVLTTKGLIRADAAGFSDKVKPGVSAKAVETTLGRFTLQPADTVLLVTNRGRVWPAPVGRVPAEAGFADLGLDKGEYLIGGGVKAAGQTLVIGTRLGNLKRTKVEDLAGEGTWAACVGLNGKDEALFAGVTDDQAEAMFFTAQGKAIRCAVSEVNPQATGSARGVAGIKVGQDDRLVVGAVFAPDKGAQVVIISQTGFAKRVPLSDFPVQGRGGQGVQSLEITAKVTGLVAAAGVAGKGAKFADVLSGKGLRCRLALDSVPVADRRKRGEKLVDFGKDDVIAGVAVC